MDHLSTTQRHKKLSILAMCSSDWCQKGKSQHLNDYYNSYKKGANIQLINHFEQTFSQKNYSLKQQVPKNTFALGFFPPKTNSKTVQNTIKICFFHRRIIWTHRANICNAIKMLELPINFNCWTPKDFQISEVWMPHMKSIAHIHISI